MSLDVVGLGNPVMDLVVNVTNMPPMDGATSANEMFYQGGGKVASAMVAVARLGMKSAMIARIGNGFTGDFIIQDFEYNGVDVSRILRSDPGTSCSFCISLSEQESKKRIFIGKTKTAPPLAPEEVDLDFIASARCLHLENGDPASMRAARFAREHGVIVCMDADHYIPNIETILPWVDVFIGSEFYFKDRYGDADVLDVCKEMCTQGPNCAIYTFGSDGLIGYQREEGAFQLPCFRVNVLDTTGAGDVFHGAYIAAMLEGKSAKECAYFASAVSAIKCTYIGGRTGIPTRANVDQFLIDGSIDTAELDARLAHYRNNL